MLHESGYNKIEVYPATKGMNQNIAPEFLNSDFSSYIENIMPDSLGEGLVRYGTSLFSPNGSIPNSIIESFPFRSPDGSEQQILYMNEYEDLFSSSVNMRIVSANHVIITNPNYAKIEPGTFVALRYRSPSGISNITNYEVKSIEQLGISTINLELEENSFPIESDGFYINESKGSAKFIDDSSILIEVPDGFDASLYYYPTQNVKLSVNGVVYDNAIAAVSTPTETEVFFSFVLNNIPDFSDNDIVIFSYESTTPEIIFFENSVGIIGVYDVAEESMLSGVGKTIGGLSVACMPRAEFFSDKLWICNGVDSIMTWDGTTLEVYIEYVKEHAQSFNRIDDNNFSFGVNGAFNLEKYYVGNTIQLNINEVVITYTINDIAKVGDLVTITTAEVISNFSGQDRIEIFYADKPPTFSYLKAAHDRLWALGEGAVSLDYRIPEEALKVYYSYKPHNGVIPFRFFNENTKTVPSIDISAKHGVADNLEAIVNVSGYMAFIGRQATQVWKGNDPVEPDSFMWSSTIPVGIFHGNLVVELSNDAYFLSQSGFLSFSTLNVASQFSASSIENMNNVAIQYLNTINSNRDYRACRAFKYKNGGFCGFKIGLNNVIVSKYSTTLYWWGLFSGDFTDATTFMSTLDDSLYIYINNGIYKYADGMSGEVIYGDRNGTRYVNFIESKHITNIKRRFANKRYEIQCDYSSDFVVSKENVVSIIIRGDLPESFTLQDFSFLPRRGDVLGTIKLSASEEEYPNSDDFGLRLDRPFKNKKGRLQFVSENFSVTLVGQTKNGQFSLKKIKLLGILER